MIDEKIEKLRLSILSSREYQKYINISEHLNKNKDITLLIEDIKNMQKKATMMEHSNNIEYKELDKKIEKQINTLNSYPLYVEYTNAKEELNDILSTITKMIQDYINEKI